jgi:hypothetical protein
LAREQATGEINPATASSGIPFHNVIIQCSVRLNDVPDEGRKYRSLLVKATDADELYNLARQSAQTERMNRMRQRLEAHLQSVV